MPSYLITGVSRGIGYAFVENLSSNPKNTVIGLVRNKVNADAKIASLNRTNVHIIQGDVCDYNSLKSAVTTTASITGGSLDYLIANAAMTSSKDGISAMDPLGVLGEDPVFLENALVDMFKTNVVGNIHLFNLFMPLILKSDVKKVITISTGLADLEMTIKFSLHENGPYSISKAAMNLVTGKFSAQYAKDGVLFLSICPGVVDTGHSANLSAKEAAKVMEMAGKLKAYAPHFTGPSTPVDAVGDVLSVIEKSSIANGEGGAFKSHLENKQWL